MNHYCKGFQFQRETNICFEKKLISFEEKRHVLKLENK